MATLSSKGSSFYFLQVKVGVLQLRGHVVLGLLLRRVLGLKLTQCFIRVLQFLLQLASAKKSNRKVKGSKG